MSGTAAEIARRHEEFSGRLEALIAEYTDLLAPAVDALGDECPHDSDEVCSCGPPPDVKLTEWMVLSNWVQMTGSNNSWAALLPRPGMLRSHKAGMTDSCGMSLAPSTIPGMADEQLYVSKQGIVHRASCSSVVRAIEEADRVARDPDHDGTGYELSAPEPKTREEIKPHAPACKACRPDWQPAPRPPRNAARTWTPP